MNNDGHQAAARIVNRTIGGLFHEGRLLAGSIDPDVHRSGRSYTGQESKHHYDTGRGRVHDTSDIASVVYRYVCLARASWKAGAKKEASFLFGVATHYYMDGFICSPSVSERKHTKGDREFRLKVIRLEKDGSGIVEVTNKRTGSISYVRELALALKNGFGATDPNIVPQALGMLSEMGRIVTDDTRYPADFENQLERMRDTFADFVRRRHDAFRNRLREEYVSYTGKRYQLLSRAENVVDYVNRSFLDRSHQRWLAFWSCLGCPGAVSSFYELAGVLDNVKGTLRSAAAEISAKQNDCSRKMAASANNEWYSEQAMSECASRYSRAAETIRNTIGAQMDSYASDIVRSYKKTVRDQDRETVGGLLKHQEMLLWKSPQEREKARMLAGSFADLFLPWILLIPISVVASVLLLLVSAKCSLVATAVSAVLCLVFIPLFRTRFDLAWKWNALEKLKRDMFRQ